MKAEKLNLVEISKICANEDSARDLLESILWPNGPVCPHCKGTKAYKINSAAGSSTRTGLYKCAACRKQFTVTVGTIFADSHIPISKWMMAIFILCSAKKAISAHQLHRSLGIAYKSAWFMAHRLRHAMASETFAKQLTGTVEVDETYIGGKNTGKGWAANLDNKTPVVTLVERGGDARSMVMDRVTGANLKSAARENVMLCSNVYTDEHMGYVGLEPKFEHKRVKHTAKEYARREGTEVVHTNTVEGFFSLLKRGVIGSFHHVSRKHLPKYLSEFDFRYNHRKTTDGERTVAALLRTPGKRLQNASLTANTVTKRCPVLDLWT